MSIADFYLKEFQYSDVDTVILGCTHYPLIKKIISLVLGDRINLIDSGNAIAKAVAVAKNAGIPAIGDDSGLEIDALDGAPGPVSARYGINLRQKNVRSERDRNELILDLMKSVPLPKRTARFRACVALAIPGNIIITREGVCEGFIAESPRGDDGFGYDPIFLIPDGRSMAQIGDLKNTISHRGKAIAALLTAINSGKQANDA